jgi:NB-ARC domain
LVLDNADDPDVLAQIWPGGASGAVLITSRDFNVARHPADAGFHVRPFEEEIGCRMLLNLLELDPESTSNQEDARAIANILGGLPLAINQMGSFVSQRKLPLQDFLPLYERNAAKIDARKSRLTQYEHTLSTVWEISLTRLSGDSYHLQKLLAFFDPDSVDEAMLIEGSQSIDDDAFGFLNDEME